WGRTQIQLLAQPCQVSMLAQRRVHTVQRAVRWQYTVAQNLGEANQLEGCGTALGVTGQGLLRVDKPRVARIPAPGRRHSLLQIRLSRVLGVRRRAPLRYDRDFMHRPP